MKVLRRKKQKEFIATKTEVEQNLANKMGIDYNKTPKGWLQNKLGLTNKENQLG